MSESKKVAELHLNGGLSCSQAMLTVYGKYFGLTEESAQKLGLTLSGGMGHMGKGVCGSVSAAFLLFGLASQLDSPDCKSEADRLVQTFTKKFTDKHGSIFCSGVLGYDMSKPEELDIIRQNKLTKTICPEVDTTAAELVEELLGDKINNKCC